MEHCIWFFNKLKIKCKEIKILAMKKHLECTEITKYTRLMNETISYASQRYLEGTI